MMKKLLRPGFMLAAFVSGGMTPSLHGTWLIRYLLMLMLLIAFSNMRIEEAKPTWRHILLLALNILIALSAGAIGGALGGRDFAEAAFWTGIAPTATAAAVVVGFLGGQPGYVLTGFLLTNISAAVILPFLLPFFAGSFSWLNIGKMSSDILFVIGIPAVLAALFRKLYAGTVRLAARLGNFSFGLWVAILFIVAADTSRFLRNMQERTGWKDAAAMAGLSAVICILNFLIGAYAGDSNHRKEASQILGQKNMTFIIYLALTYSNPLTALAPAFYVLWHNLWNAIQLYWANGKTALPEKNA